MRRLLVIVSIVLVACGGPTTEPARTEPVRVEAPPSEATDEAPDHTAPRRVEADPSSGAASTREVPRRDRPSVAPPPVEPPTSF
ncbi:MAG: hypothetical protein J0L92_19810 [Deltaproteobacteria bacterium]|nr:hypothetical protein [Deltaproteobacteria bacterium]